MYKLSNGFYRFSDGKYFKIVCLVEGKYRMKIPHAHNGISWNNGYSSSESSAKCTFKINSIEPKNFKSIVKKRKRKIEGPTHFTPIRIEKYEFGR